MSNKKEGISIPALGGSSLLTVFSLLCLTVLALLCFSTALSQQRLTDSALESVTAYYDADFQAETIFARIRAGDIPGEVTVEGSAYSYSIPVTQYQTLEVALEEGEAGWTVLKWQVQTADIVLDDSLNVWDGQ